MTDKVTIDIDGRACEAHPGEMLIAVADREGIPIPRFCYHKKLSIAANCRMCLVEVEQNGRPFPKPVPACATPVCAGLKVLTRSPKALEAQKGTMEFLLINHPLDCPICDQGGECELQDVAMGYGRDVSRYIEGKRVVQDENLGALIATDMTRCIHCTRCVRFGAEIAGVRELGATGRGEHVRIGTFVEHAMAHELSGNIIDLCPVGALTSKPYRFHARAWELSQFEGLAPHDGLGSNLHLHVRRNQVMRVHPRDNEAINETWISDRDRFSYEGLYTEDRLLSPLVKKDGAWQAIGWSEALQLAATQLKAAGSQLGALISPAATLEEMFLAQRLVRGLGSADIDSRLRQQDFRGDATDPLLPWLGLAIADVEKQGAILLVGSDIRAEIPLLAHRIRKAAMDSQARVITINPYALALTFPAEQFTGTPTANLGDLAAIAKALGAKGGPGSVKDLIAHATPSDRHQASAQALLQAKSGVVLLGALAAAHPDYALLKALASVVAKAAKFDLGFLPAAANATGAALAGALPQVEPGARAAATPGAAVAALLTEPRKAYLLWNVEPGHDLVDPALASKALSQADFVLACVSHRGASVEAIADLMLPIAAFAETSGTLVNAELTWQAFRGVVSPPGEARPGWKILRVLGNLLNLEGFDQDTSLQVADEVRALCEGVSPSNALRGHVKAKPAAQVALWRLGNVPLYRLDALVRRAPALQRVPGAGCFSVHLHPDQATALGLVEGDAVTISQGDASARSKVALSEAVPLGCARIPAAVAGSETLGVQIGPVVVTKA
ncbi:MAG: NADH-quinone oxidoreductase subunit NuoG [Chromatiaceae bacterium]